MPDDRKLDREQFAAHLAEYAENSWVNFVVWSEEFDYSEADCEQGVKMVRKAAGQIV